MKIILRALVILTICVGLLGCDNKTNNLPTEERDGDIQVVETEEVIPEKDLTQEINVDLLEEQEDKKIIDEDKQEAQIEESDYEPEYEEDLNYDADVPEDFEFAANDEDYKEPVGAFCVNLNELEHLEEPMKFRNDLDAYLIYYIPTIDKEYDTYVISGTEKLSGSSHIFKIRVEGIMEGGQDLEIECRKKDGHKHFDFFSDLSPDGTEEINWGAGLIDDSEFK